MTSERYAVGLARAFGGAILFGIPLLMTMEMWSLGFSMARGRLLLLMIFILAVLVGLSYFSGFAKTFSLKEDAMDAFAAFGVGVVTSVVLLVVLAVVTLDMTWSEIVGRVALQSVPASFGAMLGRRQLGAAQDMGAEEERKKEAGYCGELFLMLAGALFLAFNLAPTEEMILIAFQMTPWHALALSALSIMLLHVFVYNVGFSGQESRPEGVTFVPTLMRFTLAGYGIALLVSLYVLGRTTRPWPRSRTCWWCWASRLPLGRRWRGWWCETEMNREYKASDIRPGRSRPHVPWLEWVASAVGLLLVLGIFGVVAGRGSMVRQLPQ